MVPVLLALVAQSAFAEDTWPPATTIPDAASIQLTPQGLDAIAGLAPGLVPGSFDIPDQSDSGGGGFCLFEYAYSFTNGWVGMSIDDIRLVPTTGQLELEADFTVWINDASDKFDFSYDALCLDGNCPGYVDPFPVTVRAPISLDVPAPGSDLCVDAYVGEITVENGLEGKHIKFDGGCLSDVEEILNYVGISIYDYLIDMIEPFIVDMVQDYRADIEEQLEGALAAACYDGEVDVGGIPLHINLEPRDILITPGGVEVLMQGLMEAPPDECTAEYGVPGSLKTLTPPPAITANPVGTQAVLHLSDDIANQALYALWGGGLLCYELSEGSSDIELPVSLNTSLLSVLSSEFDAIFPEQKPLVIKTAPKEPPRVDYQGAHDVEVDIREMDVNFFAEIDHRMARAVGLTVTGDVGVDVNFDGTTGLAAIDVTLEDAISFEATHNEIVPTAKEEIEENFTGLVGTLLGSMLGDALSDLSFGVPSADGMGLTALELTATGGGDWLGAYAKVGAVTYEASEGCGGSSCATGSGLGAIWLVGLLPLVLRRRR